MKKLFFSALVAVAAIGGAVSVNAQYLPGSSVPIPCSTPPSPSCAIALGLPPETVVYCCPDPDQREPIGTLADYTFDGE